MTTTKKPRPIKMTDEQIEQRLAWCEQEIANERDPKNLPTLNSIFQQLIDEQVRRELSKV